MSISRTLKGFAHHHRAAHRLSQMMAAACGATLSGAASAQIGGGLASTTSFLTTIRDQLYLLIPIVAVIGGLIIFVLYMNNVLHKEIAVRWFLGLLLISMVGEIVAMAIKQ